MADNKKVIIIGAGIAGLCAGVYLKKANFEVEILEAHYMAGGLCMAWKRGDYIFDTCIHWLVGSKSGTNFHKMWQEVMDIDSLQFINSEIFTQVEDEAGGKLFIYRDVNKFEAELLAKAPEDAAEVKKLTAGIRKFSKLDFPMPGDSRWVTFKKIIGMAPMLLDFKKATSITCGAYSKNFKNPLLVKFLNGFFKDMSLLGLNMSLAWMSNGDAGYPLGGSLVLINKILENYQSLGGKIRYGARVEKILVEGDKAAGVRLINGEEFKADYVVSAADGYSTIYKMLDGKFLDEKIERPYKGWKTFSSYLQVSLGVAREFPQEKGTLALYLKNKIKVDDKTELNEISARFFNFDPSMAPVGKTAITTFLPTDNCEYWVNLRDNDRPKYDQEKKRLADEVINIFENRYPGFKSAVEVIDVSSPASIVRYTSNWRGSMEGWLITPQSGFLTLPQPKLNNFCMVGQWVMPGGGLPSGLMTAREASIKIVKLFA